MKFRMTTKAAALFLLVAILTSCSSPTPTVEPVNTEATLNALRTLAVQTIVADQTLNAPSPTPIPPTNTPEPPTETPLPPTETPLPADTATPLPTATATRVIVYNTPVPTATATAGVSCQVTEQSPGNNTEFKPGTDFDMVWKLKNTGSKTWSSADADFKYISGTKLQKYGELYDLGADVAANGTYTFTVDMVAPTVVGTFTTSWALVSGGQTVCSMSVTIKVVE